MKFEPKQLILFDIFLIIIIMNYNSYSYSENTRMTIIDFNSFNQLIKVILICGLQYNN